MHLPGAAAVAQRFARWALDSAVPASRIWLATSPDYTEDLATTGVKIVGTTQHALEQMFVDASKEAGELLLVFWCGHGVLNETQQRALFTADATVELKRNLVVSDILNYLSSRAFQALRNQIIIIDSCANFVQNMHLPTILPGYGNLQGGPPHAVSRAVLYSASEGQPSATKKTIEEMPFSKMVLDWLVEHDAVLPRDFDSLCVHVESEFIKFGGDRNLNQRPVQLNVRYFDGSEELIGKRAPLSAATLDVIDNSHLQVSHTWRITDALNSLQGFPDGLLRRALVRACGLRPDEELTQYLSKHDLVARVLARNGIEPFFDDLLQYAVDDEQTLALEMARHVWRRQEKISSVELHFPGITTQQMLNAYYWAAPDGGIPPRDLDQAMDHLADYGQNKDDQLPLHRFVAALEAATSTSVPDEWFGLSANRVGALRDDARRHLSDTPHLVIEILCDGDDWPNEVLGHRYIPGRGWLPPDRRHCTATLEGVRRAVNQLFETVSPNCVLGFLVPRSAIDAVPESWVVETALTEPDTLWRLHPVILHSVERRTNPRAHTAWSSKSNAITARLQHHSPDVTWIRSTDPQVIRRTVRDGESPCYGFVFPPATFCGDLRKDPLMAAIAEGAPYLIWTGRSSVNPNFISAVEDLVTVGSFDQVPSRLHKLREQSPPDVDTEVRMVWDDPRFLPPKPRLLGISEGTT